MGQTYDSKTHKCIAINTKCSKGYVFNKQIQHCVKKIVCSAGYVLNKQYQVCEKKPINCTKNQKFDYLTQKCRQLDCNEEFYQSLVIDLYEKDDHPKVDEYLKRKQITDLKHKFLHKLTVTEFLKIYKDPAKVFNSIEKVMCKRYRDNAYGKLVMDLPGVEKATISTQLEKNKYHYLPTLKELLVRKLCSKVDLP